MLRYLGIRLLGLIPLLFLITLMGFGFTSLFPLSNEVLLMGEIDAQSNSYKMQRQKRKALLEEFDLDKPLFYFELRSLAEDDALSEIEHPLERKLFRKLALSSGNWPAVEAFRNSLLAAEADSLIPDSSYAFQVEVNLIMRRSFSSLPPALERLSSQFPILSRPVIISYQEIYQGNNQWKSFIPYPAFHGTQNRYHIWLMKVLGGFDWGKSYSRSSMSSVKERLGFYLPWTIMISLMSILLALLISIPLGIWTALQVNSWKDKFIRNLFFFIDGIPNFWLALLMLHFFANPDYFYLSRNEFSNAIPEEGESMFFLILRTLPYMTIPLITYSYGYIIFLSRMVRANLLDVLQQDFLLAAKVRAIPSSKRIWKYAARNALLPVITVAGGFIPSLVSGSVILEEIFSIKGMGVETLRAVSEFDIPILLGILVLSAVLTLLGYLISDLINMWVDPRVRFDS
ncbi:MAG: ABC transporter permease [Bacteroidota bacterium]